MRLLFVDEYGNYCLENFIHKKPPPYAILSHTWGTGADDEVTYEDIVTDRGRDRPGFAKLEFCSARAKADGLRYFWIDTCSIKKSDSSELSEAINSMFRWYQNAAVCYVFLSDVAHNKQDGRSCSMPDAVPFKESRWFTRGWTLQELLAPRNVIFFSREGESLGTKDDLRLRISAITGLPDKVLCNEPLCNFASEERLLWGAKRHVTRPEDKAYCMIGILEVDMDPRYGKGEAEAMDRLRRKVYKKFKRSLQRGDDPQASKRQRTDVWPDDATSVLTKDELISLIHFEQIDARLINIKRSHRKTCQWILREPVFLDWLDCSRVEEHHGFLWIRGKPGCGKSTLAKFIFMELKNREKHTKILSFFFNARGDVLEQRTSGVYRSLIIQLLDINPSAYQALHISMLRQWKDLSAETQNWLLKTVVVVLLQNMSEDDIIIVIDALDECDEDEVRDMIALLEKIGEEAVEERRFLRVLLLSRHYPNITIHKSLDMTLEDQPGHDHDIQKYIEQELKRGNSKSVQDIRPKILQKSSGVFMWVVLVVQILNKEIDHGQVRNLGQKLKELPGDLNRLFRDILGRDTQHMDEMKLVLQWILYATRPLNREELYFAVLSGLDADAVSSPWNSEDVSTEDMDLFILSSSKGLAEVTKSKDHTVQFIHESVPDFLRKADGLGQVWKDLAANASGKSHDRLKDCCSKYITTIQIQHPERHVDLPPAKSAEAQELRLKVMLNFPFCKYAIDNLLNHSEVAQKFGAGQTHFVAGFPLSRWTELKNLLEKFSIRRLPDNVDLLYVLAERGCSHLITFCMPQDLRAKENDQCQHRNPLFAAIANNDAEVFEALVKLDQRRPPSTYEFPYATRRNVFQLLEKTGTPDMIYRFLQVYHINERSVLVSDHEANNLIDVLILACKRGYTKIASLLFQRGIRIDAEDDFLDGAIQLALLDEEHQLVRLLVENDVSFLNEHKHLARLLCLASKYGRDQFISLLIAKGVDVDARGDYNQNAIQTAAVNGHTAAAVMLLKHGADVNAQGGYYGTALQAAAAKGHYEIANILLEHGAVVNIKGGYHGTALQAAAAYGSLDIVSLLLDHGADVNIYGGHYGSALQAALSERHDDIAALLCSRGATVDPAWRDPSDQN